MSVYTGVDALVLGATGFIGRWVASALSHAGARVVCAVRDVGAMEQLAQSLDIRTRVVFVDLMDEASVAALFARHRPMITFNLAGYGIDRTEVDPALAQRINAELVRDLVTLCRAPHEPDSWPGHRLVHVGSALEYGPIGGSLPETTEARPDTLYGRTKLAGTLSTRNERGAMTARLFTVYGAGESAGRLLPSLLAARAGDAPVALTAGTQSRDFTYVEDVADGLLRLGAAADLSAAPVNLATGVLSTVRAFAEMTAAVAGIPATRLHFGARAGYADETPHDVVSIARLLSAVHWSPPTTLAEGVRRTIVHTDRLAPEQA